VTTWSTLCGDFAAFARAQEYVVGGYRAPYTLLMMAAANGIAFDADAARRERVAVAAAGIAVDMMYRFSERAGLPVIGSRSVGAPEGSEGQRVVIATSGLGVLLGDESFLSVAAASLGFSGSLASRDLLASVVGPRVVRNGREYVLRSALATLHDIIDHDYPRIRLHERVAMRCRQDRRYRPMTALDQPVLSLEDVDEEMLVASEHAPEFTQADLEWCEAQLRATGKRQHEKTASALAAYRATGGSRLAMGESLYWHLHRQLHAASYLGWLLRQRAGL